MTRFPEFELLEYAQSDPVKQRAAILHQAIEAHAELREQMLIVRMENGQLTARLNAQADGAHAA